ncbi:MAG: Cna B-type domain-containing protein [Lachnospiraceae bacterium]|nr:Cna B-type domain-containing protein [Lachnospiraceae bacterium]
MKKRRFGKVIAILIAVAMLFGSFQIFGGTEAYAAAGDVPTHTKSLTDVNHDGTYQLELTVKGDADTEVETAANVNVLIVYDVSNSMTSNAGNTRYSRADQAEDVMHDFIENLRGYQSTSDPRNIQMALVTFARTGSQTQGWTSDLTGGANGINRFFDDGGTDGSTNLTYTGNASYGTNWESALSNARTVLNGADTDPTFVIFVTDGAPTASGNGNNAISPNSGLNQLRPFYEAGLSNARAIQTRTDTKLFGIYAYGTEADLLDDLMYYANNGRERTIRTQTDPTDNYYNAGQTEQLNEAIEAIFQEIVETLGVTAVSITDGTTSDVQTTSGPIDLLEVDDTSFAYWMSIPVTNGQFTRINPTTGEETTYRVTANADGTCRVTGGASPITVTGTVSGGNFKFKWEGATELSDGKTPPAATFDGKEVKWNLNSVGTLLDGVTYSVTFDVWPSQYTYDTLAKMENGDQEWSALDTNVKKYLTEDGALLTNTYANLTYSDSRTNIKDKTVAYNELEPVALVTEKMSVHKTWENELDARKVGSIDMTVLMDGEEFHDVTLSDPAWSAENIKISTGIMRTKNGSMQILDTGHDFTFAELGPEQFNWELVTPIMHPMIIDGKLTMLIMVDKDHPAPSDAKTYQLDGKTYYVAGEGEANLEAYNYRRSNLNLSKVVTGEDAPADATFPFTLTVKNSKADDPSSTDTNTDNFVWFSIFDTVAGSTVMDATVSATGLVGPNADGYYYVKSGTAITVNMKAGWNLRFTNLPTETTYTFAEGNLADGFAFNKAELTSGDDSTFSGGKTTTGTIENTNTSYQVEYTNDYELTNLEITKVWVDNSDQDGLRPVAADFANLLTLSPAVQGAEPTVVDNGDDTYTITYTGLPRFANGQEVEYEVAESAIDGYDTTGSPAKDHGTITNTHEPEKTQLTVTKNWQDQNDQDGKRASVGATVQLYKIVNGVKTAIGNVIEVGTGDDWSHVWTELAVYEAGNKIKYAVEEILPTGSEYQKSGDGEEVEAQAGDSGTVEITNSYTPETTKVTATKKWNDNNNKEGKRPSDATVQLYKTVDGSKTAVGDPVTVPATDGTIKEWTGLPVYENGKQITYSVEETLPTAADPKDQYTKSGDDKTLPAVKGDSGTIAITNSLQTGPVKEVYSGSTMIDGQEVEAGDVLTYKVTYTNTSGSQADVTITDKIPTYTTFKEAYDGGTFNETTGTITWVKTLADGASVTVSFDVTVNEDVDGDVLDNTAKASANEVEYDSNPVSNPTPTFIKLNGKKILTGRDMLPNETFTFTLAAAEEYEDVKMPASTTVTVKDAKDAMPATVEFDKIYFSKAGEYQFTVTETAGSAGGMTYDTAAKNITVTVSQDQTTGKLTAAITAGADFTFNNTYEATGSWTPVGTKTLIGTSEDEEIADDADAADDTDTDDANASNDTPTVNAAPAGGADNANAVTTADDEAGANDAAVESTDEGQAVTGTDDQTEADQTEGTVEENNDTESDVTEVGTTGRLFGGAFATHVMSRFLVQAVAAEDDASTVLPLEEKDFTFTVAYANDTSKTVTTGYNEASDGKADIVFGTVQYTTQGENSLQNLVADGLATKTKSGSNTVYTIPYIITEDSGDKAGVTYDKTTFGVTVTVTDSGTGTLAVSAVYDDPADFINTYKTNKVKVPITGLKVLEGSRALAADEFTFNLTGQAPLPTKTTAKNDAAGTVDFGEVTFEKSDLGSATEKTFTYTITEEEGSLPGVTYDTSAKTVTITVTDDGEGHLSAVTSPEEAPLFTVTNTYEPVPGKADLTVYKELTGRDLEADEFTFELLDADGEVVKTASNDAEGVAVFKDIEFKEAGSFKFTVVEVIGTLDNIEYDPNVYNVTATVTDNFDGQPMTVEWTIGSIDEIVFDNTYPTVVVKGVKIWNDDKYFKPADEDGDIPAENGYQRPESVTINLYADGDKIDETTASEDTNWAWEFTELPMYSGPIVIDGENTPILYTVTETDEAGFESEIDPESYDVSGEDITEFDYDVINTPLEEEVLEPTDLIIKKTDEVTGNVIGTGATFELTGGDLEEPVKYVTGEDGTVTVKFEKDGKYQLAETIAPEGYVEDDLPSYDITVKKDFIKVELNEDKNLWQWFYDLFFDDDTKALFDEDEQTLVVPNPPKTTDIEVTKIWDDENNKVKIRPESVTFNLYRTTEIEEESDTGLSADLTAEMATEDDANTWKYVFEQVPAYRDGYPVTYTVKELDENGNVIEPADEDAAYSIVYKTSYSEDQLTVTNAMEFGDLEITKTVEPYEDNTDATFVFSVVATVAGIEDPVYENIVALTFDGPGSKTASLIGEIPVGADVTVTEVYGGADYEIVGDLTANTTIVSNEDEAAPASVEFTNTYDDTLNHGYGVLNKFAANDEGTWTVDNSGDSSDSGNTVQ